MKISHNCRHLSVGTSIAVLLNQLKEKIIWLFELEEVEVDFEVKGKRVKYTYKKVEKAVVKGIAPQYSDIRM